MSRFMRKRTVTSLPYSSRNSSAVPGWPGFPKSRRPIYRLPGCFHLLLFEVEMDDLKSMIREAPDLPKKGILFYDITTLLKDKTGFKKVIDTLTERVRPLQPDVILGIEARGFIFSSALAHH